MFMKNEVPLFPLGQITVMGKATTVPRGRLKELLYEHRRGHWGFIEPEVAVLNARSLSLEKDFVTSLHRVGENDYLVLATSLDDEYTIVRFHEEAPEDIQKRLRIGEHQFIAFVPKAEGYLH